MPMKSALSVILLVLGATRADIYMHVPAGSNNRNRERQENRRNANRLFDSQNNDKGGYAWQGDREVASAPDPMTYYAGSKLRLEWTAQHGCGADPSTHCEVVIQYACEDTMASLRDGYPTGDLVDADNNNGDVPAELRYQTRAFQRNTGGNNDNGGEGTNTISEATQDDTEYGMHENFAYYEACQNRQRNKGLYTADQNLNGDDATRTRQNPNGGRSGFECPEERDYYPYWSPSPWRDVAVLVSDLSQCSYYQENSRNVRAVGHCEMSVAQQQAAPDGKVPISQGACEASGGAWEADVAWGTTAPECDMHPLSRQNHLGDVVEGSEATAAHYEWEVPADALAAARADEQLCVVRMRYNVSTADYASLAGMAEKGAFSEQTALSAADNCEQGDANGCGDGAADLANGAPRYNRPYVQAFEPGSAELGIALNTNQASRTFQDRSFAFRIARRPANSGAAPIYNVNVRGKRGNIVQTFPAVEYDIVPPNLEVPRGSLLHIQWTGSDFNVARGPNNAEGWRYSDRTNLMQVAQMNSNFPLPAEQLAADGKALFWPDVETMRQFALQGQEGVLAAKGSACGEFEDGANNEQNDPRNCGKLNSAPAHFDGGLLRVDQPAGSTFYFVSTRNNNFSNRAQKWRLTVRRSRTFIVSVIGLIVLAFAIVALLLFYLRKRGYMSCERCGKASVAGGTTKKGNPTKESGSRKSSSKSSKKSSKKSASKKKHASKTKNTELGVLTLV